MKRSRGFGTFDLIIWLGGAVVVVAMLAWVNKAIEHYYVDPVVAQYAPVMAACAELAGGKKQTPSACVISLRNVVIDNNKCLAANDSLKKEYSLFVQATNQKIGEDAEEMRKLRARRAAAEKIVAPQREQLALDKFNMIVELNKPDGGLSCLQLDDMLLEEAKRKVKYYGGTNSPSVQEPVPAGAVRIAPQPQPTKPPQAERPRVPNPLVRPR